MIDKELKIYIEDEIIPQYRFFDDAHKEDHALTVIRQSMLLMEGKDAWLRDQACPERIWQTDINPDLLYVAAACHDIGLKNGRERHHLDSGAMVRADENLMKWFTEEEVELIAQAAEDHRASGKGAPRSIYGMIVAEADRVIDTDTIIRRTIQFGHKHYPGLSKEDHINRAIDHLHEKYGHGGYLKLWIPWGDNASRLHALQELIDSPDSLRERVEQIYLSFDTIVPVA